MVSGGFEGVIAGRGLLCASLRLEPFIRRMPLIWEAADPRGPQ